jgi:hypothetical protein
MKEGNIAKAKNPSCKAKNICKKQFLINSKEVNMTRKFIILLISSLLIVSAAVFLTGCGADSSDNSGPVDTYTQAEIDNDVAWVIMNGMIDMYNQNFAGNPVGAKNNIAITCPSGGNAIANGTVSNPSGITNVNFTYDMTSCIFSRTSGSTSGTLTLNGQMNNNGAFDMATDFFSDSFKTLISQTVTMQGTVTRSGLSASIDQTCEVAINRSSSSISGTLCARSFGWDTSSSVAGIISQPDSDDLPYAEAPSD